MHRLPQHSRDDLKLVDLLPPADEVGQDTNMSATALQMKKISKSFPGVKALMDVDFSVRFGSVHAIVGENGAGKSTLMNILGGVFDPTTGSIEIAGVPVRMRNPADAQKAGIRMVHQELNLVPELSVAENIYLGRMPKRLLCICRRKMSRDAALVLAELGATIDPDEELGRLSISQRQLVEIAKAYAANPRIIVLDEPTSSLSEYEASALFAVLRKMKQRGIAIIYISHRLKEVMDIADDVTVLRDGKMIVTRPAAGLSAADMIKLMVGRDVTNVFPKTTARIGEPVFRVSQLSDGRKFTNISFDVRSGEILGITGLVGAGRTELARAIIGLGKLTSGSVEIKGRVLKRRSPSGAMKAGIVYVPEDRKRDGIVPLMAVRDNISLPVVSNLSLLGIVRTWLDRQLAVRFIKEFSIAPPNPERRIDKLSGGNQQKAVIAKWIASKPSVLILDEPTRGVDVGAKAEIHNIIGRLVSDGLAVILISSELPEILGVSDRIVVMREGRASQPIERSLLSDERIMALATGEEML